MTAGANSAGPNRWRESRALAGAKDTLSCLASEPTDSTVIVPPPPARFPTPSVEYGALSLLVAGVFLVGLYPQPLFDLMEEGAVAMMATSEATTVGALGEPP